MGDYSIVSLMTLDADDPFLPFLETVTYSAEDSRGEFTEMASSGSSLLNYKLLTGSCPDEQCHATLFFPAHDSSIECTNCGQRHSKSRIKDVKAVTDMKVALHNLLKNVLLGKAKPKKGTDSVKVRGISNFQCKMLSPLLTNYGMDKKTGKAILLIKMQPPRDHFDCSVLGDRAFLIEAEHIEVMGYGRDRTGSMIYLSDTLNAIKKFNNNTECLLPIHADGDGHCLVHAVSRALIGRELFWHPLRDNLKRHLQANVDKYQALFADFVESSEWSNIIAECDPDFLPLDGDAMGLRNIHIFGLANVLRRPVVLLDSLGGIQSKGDYSGIFLPGLYPPSECSKDGIPNKPLCVAWSNAGRNHYIALVAVRGRPLPRLPEWMVPKVWGMNQSQASDYLRKGSDGSLEIGGDKCLTDKYIRRLVDAMEEVFYESHKVTTSLVADVHQYIFKSTGYVGIKPEIVLDQTQRAVNKKQLYRCLTCEALTEWVMDRDWFHRGGLLYKIAVESHKKLDPTKLYKFPMHGYICSYDAEKDELIPDMDRSQPLQCQFCQGAQLRHVTGEDGIVYINGDRTKTESNRTRCQCGFKHYWDDKEYDNLPEIFPISLDWGGQAVQDKVVWFQYESDPALNSNVFEVAQQLVQKYFPGEFGSERLVQKVVDTILRQTAQKDTAEPPPLPNAGIASSEDAVDASWRSDTSSKIILTGHGKKTIHKEELTMSATETEIQKRVEAKAPHMQKRKTDELSAAQKLSAPGAAPSKGSPTKQSPKQARTTSGSSPDASPNTSTDGSPKTTVTPGGKRDGEASGMKKVRVNTSDGRQLTLTLAADITYHGLQERLSTELNIPGDCQKIKHGFPPKVMEPPAEGAEDNPLHIQNGDKITVEIIPSSKLQETEVPIREPTQLWPAKEPQRQSWSGFDINAHDQSAQSMLQGLDDLQNAGQDSLDSAIASLALMATLMGKDLWTYVQTMPHLFSVGGLFYKQVDRDLGLSDGKHCTLPTIPGKVFRYNHNDDRLELCLEPQGHFPIEPGIERKILSAGLTSPASAEHHGASLRDTIGSGSSGIVVNKPMEFPKGHSAFSGQGHSLISGNENIRMPQDLDLGAHRQKAMHFHGMNQRSPDSIQEEPGQDVAMATDKTQNDTNHKREPQFKRLGPGVTVLNEEASNDLNVQSDMFRTLASQLENIVKETEEENMDDFFSVNSPISPTPKKDDSTSTKPLSQSERSTDPTSPEPMDST